MKKKQGISPTAWTLFGLSLLALLVLIAVFFRGGGGENIRPAAGLPSEESVPPQESTPQVKTFTLFFLSEEDGLLHPEPREIPAAPSVVKEAEEVVEALIKGSEKGFLSPFPAETKLRQLFITKEGMAYVDFSREFMEKHPSGSSAEMATVYSVVNTLAFNFKPIKKVFILVEGGEKETLSGHINLNQAFLPLYSLNAR
ncbi:MAG: GerMN domain-containing protein [Acidobacteriota bacterium]